MIQQTTELKPSRMSWLLLIIIWVSILTFSACRKKPAAPAPPPPPPPAVPTASLSAEPEVVEAGHSSTLTWQTQNANEVMLDGQIVEASGSKTVSPNASTTYRLAARGPGGVQLAAARVTVTPPPPPPAPPVEGEEELFAKNVKSVFFDYDKYDIRPDQKAVLQADLRWLLEHPNVTFTIEGHCDERGSEEYNLALGENRAQSVRTALMQGGVGVDRIRTVSYGKEKPICSDSNESCWEQNRRGQLAYGNH